VDGDGAEDVLSYPWKGGGLRFLKNPILGRSTSFFQSNIDS
jgi:hypothetical protein